MQRPPWVAFRNIRLNPKGFTLFEILMAVLLLAVAIAPILNAFTPAMITTGNEAQLTVFNQYARGTLNRTAVLDFKVLNTYKGDPVVLSDLFGSTDEAAKETFSFQGESHTPAVAIVDQSGGEGGLLEISVTLGSVNLKTLKAEY